MTNAHEHRDLPAQNWAQQVVSSVAYQCPEIAAGLLLLVIGWVLWWPAGWLGAACVAYALVAATVRHIREQQITDPAVPGQEVPPSADGPGADEDTAADQGISDRTRVVPPDNNDVADAVAAGGTGFTTDDQPESGRQA